MSKWLNRVLQEIGDRCGNYNQWRRLVDDYFLEKCPTCGDEEIYIFNVDKKEVP